MDWATVATLAFAGVFVVLVGFGRASAKGTSQLNLRSAECLRSALARIFG
jgi:hypothetical protein